MNYIIKHPVGLMNRKSRLAALRAQRFRGRGRPYRFESERKSRAIYHGRLKIEKLIQRGIAHNGVSFWKKVLGWL